MDVDQLADQVYAAVKRYVDDAIRGDDERLTRYADQVHLETKAYIDRRLGERPMSFRAAYDPGKSKDYLSGDVVQRANALFVCMVDSPTGKPGESSDWRLIAGTR